MWDGRASQRRRNKAAQKNHVGDAAHLEFRELNDMVI